MMVAGEATLVIPSPSHCNHSPTPSLVNSPQDLLVKKHAKVLMMIMILYLKSKFVQKIFPYQNKKTLEEKDISDNLKSTNSVYKFVSILLKKN